MSDKNSTSRTLATAFLLCLVCSILVAGAAVILKPLQFNNKLLDRNKNILSTVGLFDVNKTTDAQVEKIFEQFEPRFLDIRQGVLLTDEEAKALSLNVNTYDQQVAAKDPQMSYKLTPHEDIASIGGSQAKYVLIYLLKEQGVVKRLVLPVSGYGLWGTLYGFMAIENDANTVAGLSFYQHKETPGLGAKVDLPEWKALWPGKKIYDAANAVKLHVVKGKAEAHDAYQIDGLSGATLTSTGVSNLLKFWMGDLGYKPFLSAFKKQQLHAAPATASLKNNNASPTQQGVN